MKQKRRISAIIRRLEKMNRTAEVATALKTLQWVLEDGVEDFSEIIPSVQEPKPKLTAELFQYDKEQFVWVMKDPLNEGAVFIADKLPKHTPKFWWEKRPLSEISEEVSFGDDYLEIELSFGEREKISWVEIQNVFTHFSGLFRTKKDCEKFLSYYYPIDWENYLEIGEEDRAVLEIKTSALRAAVEEYYDAEFIYSFKRKGEIIWAMRKIK